MLKKNQRKNSISNSGQTLFSLLFSSLQSSRAAIVAVLMLSATYMFAQPKDNSPFSRLALGDLVQQQFAASRGFGGLSAAYQHPFHINTDNPASLSYLRSTAFEVGLYAKYASISDNAGNENDFVSGNVRYFALAFPLQNPINRELERDKRPFSWGMNLALVPYTQVGYNIENVVIHPVVDTTFNRFNGEGGTSKFVWGNGFRYKEFSLGVNAGFLFGNIIRESETTLVDEDVSYTNFIKDDYSVSGIVWSFGAQYRHDFKTVDNKGNIVPSGKSIIAGAYGNSKNSYKTKADQLFLARNFVTSDVDTVLNVQGVSGEGKLPSEFTLGLMYQDVNKLRLGAEFGLAQWSGFESEIERAKLEDTYNVKVGVEWIPDFKSYNSYLKRMSYRAGFRHGTDPRGTDGNLQYTSFTLGLGMPIVSKNSRSYLDWAFEFGRFVEEGGLEENFARLTLGFTLNDNGWFFKRRYN